MSITWKIESLSDVKRDSWESLEKASKRGSSCAFQSLKWAEVMYKINGQRSVFVTFYSNNQVIGGLRFWETGKHWFPTLFSADGPLTIAGCEEILGLGIASFFKTYSKRYPNNRLEMLPGFPSNLEKYNLTRVSPSYFSFVIDLTADGESLWRSLEKKTRWGINKAKNNGLYVRPLTIREDWSEFQKIQEKHYYEKGYSGSFSTDFVNEMYQTLLPSELVFLFGCFLDEKMIGACLLRTLNGYAIYYRGVTHSEFRSYASMDFLLWNSILWAKEKGYLYFDLGGASPNDKAKSGLWKYKSKWGGRAKVIPEYSTSFLFRMFSDMNSRTTDARWIRTLAKRALSYTN